MRGMAVYVPKSVSVRGEHDLLIVSVADGWEEVAERGVVLGIE